VRWPSYGQRPLIHKTTHAVQISPGGEAGAVVRIEQIAKHLVRLFRLFASVDRHLKKKKRYQIGPIISRTQCYPFQAVTDSKPECY